MIDYNFWWRKQERKSGWRSGKDLGAEDLTRGGRPPRKKNEADRAGASFTVPCCADGRWTKKRSC